MMGKLINKTTENKFDNSAFKLSKSDHFMSDMDLKQQQQQSKNHSFKIEDILNTNSLAKLYTNSNSININNNNNIKKVNSSASSSSSSYCSPISSLPSPYAHQPQPQLETSSSNEIILNQMHFNPFANFYFNTNNLNPNQNDSLRNFSSALIDQFRQNQFEYLKSSILNNNNNNNADNTNANNSNNANNIDQFETTNKISMIDELAKQIDNYSETNKLNNNSEKKKKKVLNKNSNSTEGIKDEVVVKKKEKYTCPGNCSDLACSSMLGSDPSQLPMCLRGTSEEQLHLASLFNTLIHHKKCRRTRTVFSDMQLIGLEKRFENQKYLSTPDRLQLAEFLGLSQLQVKTWYQNRRMKWKKKVLKDGSQDPPTKPKGRPKKNSIPSFSEILKAAAANNNSTGSSAESIVSSSMIKNSSLDENTSSTSLDDGVDLSDDDENEQVCYDYDESDSDDDNDDTHTD